MLGASACLPLYYAESSTVITGEKTGFTIILITQAPLAIALGFALRSFSAGGIRHWSHRHALSQLKNPLPLIEAFAAGKKLIGGYVASIKEIKMGRHHDIGADRLRQSGSFKAV